MVGRALLRRLQQEACEILTSTRTEVDLRDQQAVTAWFQYQKPDIVIIASATVGGIYANQSQPAEFLYDNLIIATNLIHAAKENHAAKLLFLGSSCIYPRNAPQPISEEALLTGSLEPTNQWYSIAKIAGLKLIEAYRRQYNCNFISCMPANLYGPFDNYNLKNSHVLPALLRKIHEAKITNKKWVTLWGTGQPKREFLFVDDLADACIYLLKYYSDDRPINIGSGEEVTIAALASMMANIIGFVGEFIYDTGMPDGTPQKLLNISRMKSLGWTAETTLNTGIQLTYQAYLRGQLCEK